MKQFKKRIAVVTVNYNNPLSTIACINSFSKNKLTNDYVYYIVNNGCTDDSKTVISQKLKDAIVLNSPTNLGFAGGCNLGIKKASKDGCSHILLINNDAEIASENFFDKLLLSPYDISSAVIITVSRDKKQSDYGGMVDWAFGRNTHRSSQGKIDYVSGACFFAKSEVFKKVGKFDERFFLYYEDADYCLRAKKLGYTVGVVPDINIRHQLSASTNRLGYKKVLILAQSHLLFCFKHLYIFSLPLYIGFNLYLRFSAFFPKRHR